MEVANQAVRNIHSLDLFSNTEIVPVPDEKNEGGWIVEVKLTETDQKSAEVQNGVLFLGLEDLLHWYVLLYVLLSTKLRTYQNLNFH